MLIEALFGWKTDELDAARDLIEKRFGLVLERRNSAYRGGDYYQKSLENGVEILLQRNNDNDGEEGCWDDEDYKDLPVLLRLSSHEQNNECINHQALTDAGFVFLERDSNIPAEKNSRRSPSSATTT